MPLAETGAEGADELGALLDVAAELADVAVDAPDDDDAGAVPKAAGFWPLPPHPATTVTKADSATAHTQGRMILVSKRTRESPMSISETGTDRKTIAPDQEQRH
ncbi:hypothetical protein [Catenulispora pinisilvae]|uniref:hypothetical protein n=1 Tax=Catenulispora pinisilvae TaxID=2705253 RepID=UPI001891397B|nr:hypothetical protein [Catenulispora pinisilvae]